MYQKLKQKFEKHTFTLLEVMLVVSMLGIFMVALLPKLQGIQGRARDAQRKHDIIQITQGLSVYYLDNHLYPIQNADSGAGGRETSTTNVWLSYLSPKYLSKSLKDPKNQYTNGYPWYTLGTRDEYMYVYANFSSGYVWNPLYTCNLKDYVVIGATMFEQTPPGMRPACPGYDRSTLMDFGFVLTNGNTYAEYTQIINTGSTTQSGTTITTLLATCSNNVNSMNIGDQMSCGCPPGGMNGNTNVRGTSEYSTTSSVCAAAQHAGVIDYVLGGNINILILPPRGTYIGSTQNGITSKTMQGKGVKGFRFYQ